MNPKEFTDFLKKLLAQIPNVTVEIFGDKDRVKLSFRQIEFTSKLLALVQSHKLHLVKQSGALWEFEITILEENKNAN